MDITKPVSKLIFDTDKIRKGSLVDIEIEGMTYRCLITCVDDELIQAMTTNNEDTYKKITVTMSDIAYMWNDGKVRVDVLYY